VLQINAFSGLEPFLEDAKPGNDLRGLKPVPAVDLSSRVGGVQSLSEEASFGDIAKGSVAAF